MDTAGAYSGPSTLDVRVLTHSAATAAGITGVIAQVGATSVGKGTVTFGMDYGNFANAFGGNYASRLRLVQLPACALTTPQLRACRNQTPLPTSNDLKDHAVSTRLAFGGYAAVQSRSSTRTAVSSHPVAQSGSLVVALTSSPSSGDGGSAAGQYGATDLKPSGSWSAGGSTGSFDYTYPITVPPAVSSLAPSVALSYDSGSVDGQTASTQAQSSWIGDGWSMAQSFIEQSFVSCSDSPEGDPAPQATGDMCYDGPILTLSLNGSSSSLVWDAVQKLWKPTTDDGEVVTHHTNANNGSGTYNTDYWTVTTRDGTVYSFGLNQLPGWSSGQPVTNSVQSEPVYSAHDPSTPNKSYSDPCYKAPGFTSSVCTMAYRWNLDYVVDLHGDAMAYYYDKDSNYYGEDNGASNVPYVRDAYLDHIDYGFTDKNAYGTVPDRVKFGIGARCITGSACKDPATDPTDFPDVPADLICAQGASCTSSGPAFFSTRMLSSISTLQWNGTGWNTVDSWALKQDFPPTGDGTSSTVWLQTITHTGSDNDSGGPSAPPLPPVQFTGIQEANRVDTSTDGLPKLNRYRMSTIETETGSVIQVNYTRPAPCTAPVTITPSSNTSSCFPVNWTPPNNPQLSDWFNKYVADSVSQSDPTGGSPGLYTKYKYPGNSAAWHYDDNELVLPKYRTYGQYRGYGDVQTITGQGSDPVAVSETWYYRGMSDDNNTTTVTLTDSQGGKHDDTNQLAGDALETKAYTYSGGSVDHSTITSYWVSPATATRTRTQTGLPALTANVVRPVESWSRQALTDNGTTTWRKSETNTTYDTNSSDAATTYGMPLFVYDTGDLSLVGTGGSQETCQQITYAPANTSLNLVALVAQTETDDKPCGGASPGASSAPSAAQINALTAPVSLNKATDVIAATRTVYDDPADAATWPQPASITQSTLTKGDSSITQAATGYSGGGFTWQTKSAIVYDSFGRPTATYDALGDKTATAYTATSYGTVTGTSTTNALGQIQTTTIDPQRSLVLTATDANKITTTVQYDSLGRTTGVWDYSRPTSARANEAYTYTVSNSAATAVTTQTLNDESGYSTSTRIYDALLRPRQTQTEAVTTAAGRIISDTFYDSHGWVTKTNQNYWDTSSEPNITLVTVADNKIDQQTVTSYDGLGRPVVVHSKDNFSTPTVDNVAYTQYTGDKTITVPPTGGVASAITVDALGRTTELDQYTAAPTVTTGTAGGFTTVAVTGGATQATTYGYNAQGRAATVTDAKNESWSTTYDYLGQIATSSDPDSGTTGTTLYDAQGNTVQTTDSAGHTLSYTYDALGRKKAEYDAPLASKSPSNEVASWAYDNSNNYSGVGNPIGHLTEQTSYTSAGQFTVQELGYNVFGEPLGEIYTVPGTNALAGSYTYKHAYTPTTGLPSGQLIPAAGGLSQEITTTGYSVFRGLDEVSTLGGLNGYTQGIAYTALGQVAAQTIGSNNNASVYNAYDPHTGALTDSKLVNTAVSSTPLDETGYTYDPAGNPTSESDTRNGAAKETQCFGYDQLDRLTQAWTAATNSCATTPTSANVTSVVGDGIAGGAYWTSWDNFDPLGQAASQTQHSLTGGNDTTTAYAYGGSATGCAASTGPHTLASATTTVGTNSTTATYCNNALGQATSRPAPGSAGQQTLAWDDEGRLSKVTVGSNTTQYLYDASGNVIERQDPASTTLFLPGQQLSLNTGTGATTGTRYIALPGGGQVVESGTTSNYRFELTDLHGTATVSFDTTVENPTWQQSTPYGAPRGTAPGTWNDPNGYLNKPQDTSDGLTTLGARQYDPGLGRFISRDSVLETNDPQQLNGYTYAAGNPITQADPTGQRACVDSCEAGGDPTAGCLTGPHPETCSGNPNNATWKPPPPGWQNDACDATCLAVQQASLECSAKGGDLNGGKCMVPVPPKPHHWWQTALAIVAVVAVVAIAIACVVQPELIPAVAAIAESGATAFVSTGSVVSAAVAAASTAISIGAEALGATTVAAFFGAAAVVAGGGSTISYGRRGSSGPAGGPEAPPTPSRSAGDASSIGGANSLYRQLSTEAAASIFDESGGLKPEIIGSSNRIINGSDLGNRFVREQLTSDGSNIDDWGKYATQTIYGPPGNFDAFKMHFYYNPVTDRADYTYDFKAVSNLR